jgi:hypothetical protein
MSIHLFSNDYSSGSIYNGVWQVPTTLNKNYKVTYQYITVDSIPWIWNGIHQLVITAGSSTGTVSFDYSTLAYETDTTIIANTLESNINTIVNAFPLTDARNCIVNYNAATLTDNAFYELTFDDNVVLKFSSTLSTSKYIFNIFTDQTISSINLYDTFIYTNPHFLDVYIDESSTQYITSRNTFPTLLWATNDVQFTGQEINFRGSTQSLTIKIYRQNIPISPVPIQGRWNLVFS